MTQDTDGLQWLTASTQGACVEVAHTDTATFVRDSKHRDGPALEFTPEEWDVFVGGVAGGTFDRS